MHATIPCPYSGCKCLTLLGCEVGHIFLRSTPVGDLFSLLQLHCDVWKQRGHSWGHENGQCSQSWSQMWFLMGTPHVPREHLKALREVAVYLCCTCSWVFSAWDNSWTKISSPREVCNLWWPEVWQNRSAEGLQPLLAVSRRCGIETWTSYTWEGRENQWCCNIRDFFLIVCLWVHILLQVVMTAVLVWHAEDVLMPLEHTLAARLLQWWTSVGNSGSVCQHRLRHGRTQKCWGISMQGLSLVAVPSTERINTSVGSSRLGR